jgi:hypothetical protein
MNWKAWEMLLPEFADRGGQPFTPWPRLLAWCLSDSAFVGGRVWRNEQGRLGYHLWAIKLITRFNPDDWDQSDG